MKPIHNNATWLVVWEGCKYQTKMSIESKPRLNCRKKTTDNYIGLRGEKCETKMDAIFT